MNRTAMHASAWPTPADRLLSTARLEYNEAQTSVTARLTWSALSTGIPTLLSYSPAAQSPARSSTLAEDRTASRAPAAKVDLTCSNTCSGRRTAAKAEVSFSSTASIAGPVTFGSSSSFTAALNSVRLPAASSASSMLPNDRTAPGGVVNTPLPAPAASRSSSPQLAAFDPQVVMVASLKLESFRLVTFLVVAMLSFPAPALRPDATAPDLTRAATPLPLPLLAGAAAGAVPSFRVTESLATVSRTVLPSRGFTCLLTYSSSSHVTKVTFSWRARTPKWLR
mmetsp:Transcript_8644/g.14891  ORF Transcript_8644/g.14891 Transcript_8644/m.14891 type:complete len:281 (+) Transcript_8644:1003-1845(+)